MPCCVQLDEMAKEGIDGSTIQYEDNQALLDMILGKPLGVLATIDEESNFPKVRVQPTHARISCFRLSLLLFSDYVGVFHLAP